MQRAPRNRGELGCGAVAVHVAGGTTTPSLPATRARRVEGDPGRGEPCTVGAEQRTRVAPGSQSGSAGGPRLRSLPEPSLPMIVTLTPSQGHRRPRGLLAWAPRGSPHHSEAPPLQPGWQGSTSSHPRMNIHGEAIMRARLASRKSLIPGFCHRDRPCPGEA